MQILAQNNLILFSAENISTYDINANQVVVSTTKYTHNDITNDDQKSALFYSMTHLFNLSELIAMYSTAVAAYYGDLIVKTYPTYKQMNIIRQGQNYTQADLQTMTTFIDNNRSACKAKIAAISALTKPEDVVNFPLYT